MTTNTRSESMKDKIKELKAKGVRLGTVPFGFLLSEKRDDQGRRVLVKNEEEQKIIERICFLYHNNERVSQIGAILESEGLLCKGKKLDIKLIFRILKRNGVEDPERRCKLVPSRKELRLAATGSVRDRKVAANRATELRCTGYTFQEIAKQLLAEGILPQYGNNWHASSVAKLLTCK